MMFPWGGKGQESAAGSRKGHSLLSKSRGMVVPFQGIEGRGNE
jgi:hypothetical protein